MAKRFNPIGIQLIPDHLRKHLFAGKSAISSTETQQQPNNQRDEARLESMRKHLKHFGLATAEPEQLPVNHLNQLKLPPLEGANIEEHFHAIGRRYSQPYRELVKLFLHASYRIPQIPRHWAFAPGTWIKYYPPDANGHERQEALPYPPADCLVMDVETTVRDEGLPAMATALSPTTGWYSWTSPRFENGARKEMIPIGKFQSTERLIIGHNVSFDRSYLAEQYDINLDQTRFLDTLSLHVSVCGLTSHQRGVVNARKSKSRNSSLSSTSSSTSPYRQKGFGEWVEHSSLNSLADCWAFHCSGGSGARLDKEPRNLFVTGTLEDVRRDFAPLMTYCAKDVIATTQVLRAVAPQFFARFPHPISLAGILEMSVMYLPLKMENWRRYVEQAQDIYDDREREVSQALKRLANAACSSSMDNYSRDIFLWDLDWTTRMPKIRKPKPVSESTRSKSKKLAEHPLDVSQSELKLNMDEDGRITYSSPLVDAVHATSKNLFKKQPILTGFPMWYREFCESPMAGDTNWDVGPYKISTGMRSVPKLMRLLWDGFPLHYDRAHGWGYLVPTSKQASAEFIQVLKDDGIEYTFPLGALHRLCGHLVESSTADLWDAVTTHCQPRDGDDPMDPSSASFAAYIASLSNGHSARTGKESLPPGQIMDLIPGVIFRKLPHKNGFKFNVGNPLSKDFIHKVEDKTLTSLSESAGWILDLNASLSYWRNAHKRIKDQLIRPEPVAGAFSAIIPRVIVSGTVTRRAVEKTWLTASNILEDRLGCELKSMISAPEGYHFVGADVDSQELWIASLLGDAHFAREHGCTALGWMTLRGNKTDGTDMHSRTASLVNISRGEAKVLNYARIYGAGVEFVQRFLQQNDHSLDKKRALTMAKAIFTSTKGKREPIPADSEPQEKENRVTRWMGGSESYMFNALELIASRPMPRTPFLHARMSKALEPLLDRANIYTTSRLNWVVQSSAVDFLHLLLICMRHMMDSFAIKGRFSISIHDEVRYLVESEDRYRAALALHLSNLYVRSFFAHRLGLLDLPLSIAFFQSVEIDHVLRKDVANDCVTMSNPHGLQLAFGVPFGEAVDMRDLLIRKKVKLAPVSDNSSTTTYPLASQAQAAT